MIRRTMFQKTRQPKLAKNLIGCANFVAATIRQNSLSVCRVEQKEAKAKIIFKYRRQTEKKNLEKQKLQKMNMSRTTKKKKSISTSKASKKIIHSMILVLTI